MKKFLSSVVILALCTGAFSASASAASSVEIKEQINEAQEMCDVAHELAENARHFGLTDDHYIIWYAKKVWNEYHTKVVNLTAQYNTAVAEENNKGEYVGQFRISFYCPCATCNGSSSGLTASGASLSVGTTIAVDPSVIPLGSKVYIEGIGWRVAQDTGGAIKGNKIDVLVASHSEAYANGIKYAKVYVK